MASKVSNLLRVMGHYRYDAGAHMYHAADGVTGKKYGKERRHTIRKALRELNLRASGMTDDIMGAKESDGTLNNKYEQSPNQ